MIKFWDRVFLILFVLGLDFTGSLLMTYGLFGFLTNVGLWLLFWSWLDSTFISISYAKELTEKVGTNDNKDSSGSGT